MKQKIRNFFRLILNNWIKIAEIGTVIWAINGMFTATLMSEEQFELEIGRNLLWQMQGCNLPFIVVLSYFFSAVLILYLLKEWGDKTK